MAPCVEIVLFPASEAYLKDPTVIYPLFDIVEGWKGSQGIYHGVQVEDGKTAYLFIVWETLKHHQDLINDPIYPKVGAALGACIDGGFGFLKLFHVHFEPAAGLGGILNAPFTALAQITKLKEGKTEANLEEGKSALFSARDVKGCRGAAWGKKVEADEWTFVTAWDKVEDHAAARTEHQDIKAFLGKLQETVAEWDAKHVSLTSYKKKYE